MFFSGEIGFRHGKLSVLAMADNRHHDQAHGMKTA